MALDYIDLFHKVLTSSQLPEEKRPKLVRIFESIIDKALEDEKLSFTSLFAKLSYLGEKYDLSGFERYELHYYRRLIQSEDAQDLEAVTHILSYLIPHLLERCLSITIPSFIQDAIPISSGIQFEKRPIQQFIPKVKFYAWEIHKELGMITGYEANRVSEKVTIDYKLQDRNIGFSDALDAIHSFPILLNLIDVEVTLDGIYRPSIIIIEPDYLVDATAVANCFSGTGFTLISYILRKFLPMARSKPLLIGNLANYFLDRLIQEPHVKFDDLIPELFEIDPLGFTVLKDDEVKGFVSDLRNHFNHIQYTVNHSLQQEGIDPAKVYLEPSFISPQYGIQGRLDLLMPDPHHPKIVELKSGSIYKANAYGVNSPHFVQTLMYDLLIRSTFRQAEPKNYILYSKERDKSLRLAPRIVAQQKEALQLRNQLLLIENDLISLAESSSFFDVIHTDHYPEMKGFQKRDIELFASVWQGLDTIEKMYFNVFTRFIAKEHKLSKIGEYGQDKSNGLAGLWLDSKEEKCEQFSMLTMLEIAENKADQEQALIRLKYSEYTNEISNFRQGDILVLYPLGKGTASPLHNQIFKCNVIDLQAKELTISLRGIQKNFQIFNENQYWALEHDTMDTSFTNMYRQLFLWAGAPKVKRELLLGRRFPEVHSSSLVKLNGQEYAHLTENQLDVLKRMITAPDYFLLWGPPGTGKTSVLICKYIQYIMDHTSDNLYVLAYTNRAVDELCAAIDSLGQPYTSNYIRIGSKYGADERYLPNMMRSKIKGISRRNKLQEKIKSHRMVVGTIASLASRQLIYDYITPDRVVVDEASQILEPNIIGLLTRFKQFVLVGDHKQLPAVVTQRKEESVVKQEELQEIGLVNRRNSLFERLYHRAKNEGKDYVYGQLNMQARMHKDIMEFPNNRFYYGALKAMVSVERLFEDVDSVIPRLGFIQAPVPELEALSKTNHEEIQQIVSILPRFLSLGFKPKEIGIITPFRAQIAAMHKSIQLNLPACTAVAIDTVERYQGSAKKVILISFCCNSVMQFEQMQSLDDEQVDRKLNVALTRAKEHLILVGDERILRTNPIYDDLLNACEIIPT